MTTYSSRRRRSIWPAVTAAAAVVLVGVGIAIGIQLSNRGGSEDGQAVTHDQLRDIQASIAALPKCAELFKLNQKIDHAKAKNGCLDPDGTVVMSGSFRCNDGRHLWQVDAATGAPEGWGFSDDVYHLTDDAASDPAYKQAYETCHS